MRRLLVLPILLTLFLGGILFAKPPEGKSRSPHVRKNERRAEDMRGRESHENFPWDRDHRNQQRHRGIDRNSDGIITRQEWPGNDQSFSKLDRNGDGILAGDELQPGVQGGKKNRRQSGRDIWSRYDSDRDGVITREELNNDRFFEKHDHNRDGVVTRQELRNRR
ncbi:MAG: EF-hand domain-containing protein [Acidobacteria bacterium]|nr:EF-hand domain-containing protein [Acidobacteriota bacterium]